MAEIDDVAQEAGERQDEARRQRLAARERRQARREQQREQRSVVAMPPSRPSTVLFGLTVGITLCRPKSLPQTYCATSLSWVSEDQEEQPGPRPPARAPSGGGARAGRPRG